mgnify:CR=1 FL=1|jgi:hypothetical protein
MARSQRTSNPVTLFPFLAVLLCTIGALVLMLVVVSAGIRKDAVATAKQKSKAVAKSQHSTELPRVAPVAEQSPVDHPAASSLAVTVLEPTPDQRPIEPMFGVEPRPAPIEEASPGMLADIADLEEVARTLETEVAARAKRLQSVSVKTYALQKQLRTVKAQQDDLQLQIIRTASQRSKLEDSTGELRVENQQIIEWLDESRKLIDEHKDQLVSPVHSIVPYDGQTGTVRRAIIIECVGDVVRFEAEQVEIPVAVLQKFSPEQNPLASGVAALFRYWMAKEQIADPGRQQRKPYALVLVRPSGAEAFSSAVFALDEMVGDFGYELVETNFLYEVPETTADAVRECRAAVEAEIRRGPIRSRHVLNPQGPIDIARVARGPAASRGFFSSSDFRNRRLVGSEDGDGSGSGSDDSMSGGEQAEVGEGVAKAAAARREADLKAAAGRARTLLSGHVAEGASLLEKGLPSSFDEARTAAALAEAARANAGQGDAVRTREVSGSDVNVDEPSGNFVGLTDEPFGGARNGSSPFKGSAGEGSGFEPGLDVQNAERNAKRAGDGSSETGSLNRGAAGKPPRWLANTDGRSVLDAGGKNSEAEKPGGAINPRQSQAGASDENNGKGQSGGTTEESLTDRASRGGESSQPFSGQSTNAADGAGSQGTSQESPGSASSMASSGGDSSPFSPSIPSIQLRHESRSLRSIKTQRRWGKSHPDASLGLEKVVEVRVETGRVVVGNQFQVTRTPERSEADIVKLTIQTLEHLANQWNRPPPRFYWVPSVSLVFEPAEHRLGILLEAAVEDAGAALEQQSTR